MSTKHTPGPWKWLGAPGDSDLNSASGKIITDYGYEGLGFSMYGEPGADDANARLIPAAPDLLEALRGVLPEGWGDDDTMDHVPGVKAARLAIAKATGGTS
jgi:hypothetical protein